MSAAEEIVVDGGERYTELLLGCGGKRVKVLGPAGRKTFDNLTTLDIEPSHKPDIVHDLNVCPWPLEDNSFNEVHAYEVLEHLGRQGDYRSWFAHFTEIWRILKPNGFLFATCPSAKSPWLWGDPGHTRAVTLESLTFLIQPEYDKQVGVTALTDYRSIYRADFEPMVIQDDGTHLKIILRAIKPSRCSV